MLARERAYWLPPALLNSLSRHLQLNPIVRCVNEVLLGPEISLCSLDRGMAQEQLDLLKLAARQSFAQVRRRSWGAIPTTSARNAYCRKNCQTTFSDKQTPQAWPALFTGRNMCPSANPVVAADSGARRKGFRGERENDSGMKTNRIPG